MLWCYILITRMGAGVFGASMALNVTYILTYAIQELYVSVYKRDVFHKYWAPLFDEESFCDWPTYIKLAVPTTGLMCIEWWAFEFIVIFAGIIGVEELAAQVAVMNVNGFIFMFPLGVQFAASALVGNQLGKGNKVQAKRYALMCVIVTVIFITSLSIMINVWSNEIAY